MKITFAVPNIVILFSRFLPVDANAATIHKYQDVYNWHSLQLYTYSPSCMEETKCSA